MRFSGQLSGSTQGAVLYYGSAISSNVNPGLTSPDYKKKAGYPKIVIIYIITIKIDTPRIHDQSLIFHQTKKSALALAGYFQYVPFIAKHSRTFHYPSSW